MGASWFGTAVAKFGSDFSRTAIGELSCMVKKTKTGKPAGAGPLIIIGGHEDKEGERHILQEVVKRAGGGSLLVMTLASQEGEEQWKEYKRVFTELGAKKVERFDLESRADVDVESKAEAIN